MRCYGGKCNGWFPSLCLYFCNAAFHYQYAEINLSYVVKIIALAFIASNRFESEISRFMINRPIKYNKVSRENVIELFSVMPTETDALKSKMRALGC